MVKKILICISSFVLFFTLSYYSFSQEELPVEEKVIDVSAQESTPVEIQTDIDTSSKKDLPSEIKIRLDAFFAQLQSSNMEPAVMDLVKGTLIENKTQELNLVIGQLRNLPIIYGPILNVEQLDTKYVGDSLLMVKYLVKLRDHPAIFEFYYYKVQDNWMLLKFWFNDQIQNLF
ncbi:MAG: hypothetical protein FJZ16_00010 [Candidatus Omnitrophica bacterium]|nr:hypothetical protein [Candidatus Omnitrophota bacterium]